MEEKEVIKKVIDGFWETTPNEQDYFFMTGKEFFEELKTSPAERRIFWNGVWRKRTTGLKIWVVGLGEIQ